MSDSFFQRSPLHSDEDRKGSGLVSRGLRMLRAKQAPAPEAPLADAEKKQETEAHRDETGVVDAGIVSLESPHPEAAAEPPEETSQETLTGGGSKDGTERFSAPRKETGQGSSPEALGVSFLLSPDGPDGEARESGAKNPPDQTSAEKSAKELADLPKDASEVAPSGESEPEKGLDAAGEEIRPKDNPDDCDYPLASRPDTDRFCPAGGTIEQENAEAAVIISPETSDEQSGPLVTHPAHKAANEELVAESEEDGLGVQGKPLSDSEPADNAEELLPSEPVQEVTPELKVQPEPSEPVLSIETENKDKNRTDTAESVSEEGWTLVPQLGHGGSVFFVTWSEDDRYIYTGSCGMVIKWDAETGRVLAGIPLSATALALSWDGRFFLSGNSDRTAGILDAGNGRKLRSLKGHDDWIMAVAFSPDGQRAVTGSWDETARVWDCASGKEIACIDSGYGQIDALAFSPDGRRILIGSWDSQARVWDSRSGKELLCLAGHDMDVNAVGFSSDGKRIITGSGDGTARVWNSESGEELFCLKGHTMDVNAVAISPDGSRFLTGSWDATARIWDGRTGELLHCLKGHSMNVDAVAFSHDGARVLTGSSDKNVKIWDSTTGQLIRGLDSPVNVIELAAWSPDGSRILACAWNTAAILDSDTGVELVSLKGHTGQIGTVAWSNDGKKILLGSWDETARIWDGKNGDELLCLKGHTGNVSTVAFFPDGKRALTCSDDKVIRVWDCESGDELLTMRGHTAFVRALAFIPDGTRLITGSEDTTARIWDTAEGRELFCLQGHSGPVEAVAFSPDGERVLTCSGDKKVRIWDSRTGDEILSPEDSYLVEAVSWSPEGKRFITGSDKETARIWESETGGRLLALEGPTHWNNAAVWSPDGKRVCAVALCRLFVFDNNTGKERFQYFSYEDGWLTLYPGGYYRFGGVERLALVRHESESRPVDPAYAAKWRLRN